MVTHFKKTRELMGTSFEVSLMEEVSPTVLEQIVDAVFEEVARIQKAYSRFSSDNELAALNGAVGEWVSVSEELYELLRLGDALREQTGGAFDVTVKSILESWGYDANYSLQESGVAGQVGSLEWGEDRRVRLGAEVDLGGLGKGYAVDRMVALLGDFENFCVVAGGDLWCQGRNERGEPWRVHFEHPTDPTQAIGWVEVDCLALASSSPSRRAWRDRHHLVDPRTGKPARDMLAVYTQAESVLLADAYATALFVMGYEAARAAVGDLPVEAMLVSPRGEICRSEGFRGELFTA